jgi:hypothetical protein
MHCGAYVYFCWAELRKTTSPLPNPTQFLFRINGSTLTFTICDCWKINVYSELVLIVYSRLWPSSCNTQMSNLCSVKLAAVPRLLGRNRSSLPLFALWDHWQTNPNNRGHVCSLYVVPIDGSVVSVILLLLTPQHVGTVIIDLEVGPHWKIVIITLTARSRTQPVKKLEPEDLLRPLAIVLSQKNEGHFVTSIVFKMKFGSTS